MAQQALWNGCLGVGRRRLDSKSHVPEAKKLLDVSPGGGGLLWYRRPYFSLCFFCSLNWPCRSNSPRHWQPASCPVRCPPQLLPSVPCPGPWPSGLPRQQLPPSSQLLSWVRLCSVLQQGPSARLQDPSSSPPTRGPRMATSSLFLASTCLHIPGTTFGHLRGSHPTWGQLLFPRTGIFPVPWV